MQHSVSIHAPHLSIAPMMGAQKNGTPGKPGVPWGEEGESRLHRVFYFLDPPPKSYDKVAMGEGL
jgi:hypothetical protein